MKTLHSLRLALQKAKHKGLSVLVLGGGTNVVLSDAGFDGLVIKIELSGLRFIESADTVRIEAAAGEDWDGLVAKTIQASLGGLECLSGIPGLVGASPIQNVGAYGQEAAETIESVECLERDTLNLRTLKVSKCNFTYRSSIFKQELRDDLIIVQVNYSLRKQYTPRILYAELASHLQDELSRLQTNAERLATVRQAVLDLRRRKAMLLDPNEPDSRSAGSFFTNPIVDTKQFQILKRRFQKQGGSEKIPHFDLGKNENGKEQIKIPAAWLIEKAGFSRGLRRGNVGISNKHALALVNYGGTAKDLLSLAHEIETQVEKVFAIRLIREPVIYR